MSDEITIILGLCGMAILIFFGVKYLVSSSDKKLEYLAERLGFQIVPQGFFTGVAKQVIDGSHQGRSIHLERRDVSLYDPESFGPSHITRITLNINNPMGYFLELKTKEPFRIRKPKSIPIGDPNFDRQYFLRCDPDEIAERIFIQTSIARRLVEVKPYLLKIEDDILEFEMGGFEMDGTRENYFLLFDLLCNLAEAFEGI